MRVRESPYSRGTYVVEADPGELRFSGGRTLPFGVTLGTVNERGTIRVDRPAASVPREYGRVARMHLEDVRRDLYERGLIMSRERRRREEEEQAGGSFIVVVDDEPPRRFHDFRRAEDYADRRLRERGPGSVAEFFRAPVAGTVASEMERYEGMPWTVPFHVRSLNEYGRISIGSGTEMRRERGARR